MRFIGQRHNGERTSESRKPAEGLSRRNLLGALAVLPVALPAAAAVPDPVFAAIERYKMLSVEYTAAVDRWAPLEHEHPDRSDAEDETSRTSDALFEQIDVLFTFRPSTIAGVAALLKYISTLEEWQVPRGLEESEAMQAVQTLCTCLAAAIEQSWVRA
ncbi:twin-arginine translocation signal domain-containing protein [Bradyrhizobium hipponense]|uniref:Twin-arginine translocation signal domain-containing protein n=1 Tax=Bradyrhizobium hipponense TaxID=2605638 RepID=A0A5S4YLV1_9BRAD|nr:twin-arginine translocation signal domain-containing protein [Bradyrhizobium hipponense]TYO64624.1 twin-arginine translocation signal domain-containing protein [Bradyrhizobium hipponense]